MSIMWPLGPSYMLLWQGVLLQSQQIETLLRGRYPRAIHMNGIQENLLKFLNYSLKSRDVPDLLRTSAALRSSNRSWWGSPDHELVG